MRSALHKVLQVAETKLAVSEEASWKNAVFIRVAVATEATSVRTDCLVSVGYAAMPVTYDSGPELI
jgi:hypothetical protein